MGYSKAPENLCETINRAEMLALAQVVATAAMRQALDDLDRCVKMLSNQEAVLDEATKDNAEYAVVENMKVQLNNLKKEVQDLIKKYE